MDQLNFSPSIVCCPSLVRVIQSFYSKVTKASLFWNKTVRNIHTSNENPSERSPPHLSPLRIQTIGISPPPFYHPRENQSCLLVPTRAHTFLLRGFHTEKMKMWTRRTLKKKRNPHPSPWSESTCNFSHKEKKKRGSNWPTLIAPRLLCPDPVLISKN